MKIRNIDLVKDGDIIFNKTDIEYFYIPNSKYLLRLKNNLGQPLSVSAVNYKTYDIVENITIYFGMTLSEESMQILSDHFKQCYYISDEEENVRSILE